MYQFDLSYDTIRNGQRVVEGIKFKKIDPKLQMITDVRNLQTPSISPSSQKRKGVLLADDLKHCKSTPPIKAPLLLGNSRSASLIPSDQRVVPAHPSARGPHLPSNTMPSAPFIDAVKGVLSRTQRHSVASVHGKFWASFDATVQVSCSLILIAFL